MFIPLKMVCIGIDPVIHSHILDPLPPGYSCHLQLRHWANLGAVAAVGRVTIKPRKTLEELSLTSSLRVKNIEKSPSFVVSQTKNSQKKLMSGVKPNKCPTNRRLVLEMRGPV
jgi:hypothetical protein